MEWNGIECLGKRRRVFPEKPVLEKPVLEKPVLEKPVLEKNLKIFSLYSM
jgi:hypothetical protein